MSQGREAAPSETIQRALRAEARRSAMGVWVVSAILLIVGLGMAAYTNWRTDTIQVQVEDNHTSSIIGRAVDCRILVGLRLPLREGGPCMDPEVLRHYDPAEAVPATQDRERYLNLLCEIALAHDEIAYVSECGQRER